MKPLIFIALLVLLFAAGYEVLSRKVTYVVPDDFSGFINVVENPSSSSKLRVSLNGIVIDVPPSGRTEYKRIQQLRKWGIVRAKYNSGKELKVHLPNLKEEGFGFWLLGVPAGERLYSFVGSRTEMKEFVEANVNKIYSSPPVDP